MEKILSVLRDTLAAGQNAVFVAVTASHGSVPRGAGSAMLVTAEGLAAGTVGGGASERDAVDIARSVLQSGRSECREYKLYENADADIDAVCGGEQSMFFRYVSGKDEDSLHLVNLTLQRIADHRATTIHFHADDGADTLTDGEGDVIFGSDEGRKIVYSLPIEVEERCIIFGAGHCSLALVPVLRSVGFRCTVFDDRPELLTKERFSDAEELILGDFSAIEKSLVPKESDYMVVMTSGHRHDCEVEEQILRRRVAYIGVIGSRKKTIAVNERLRAAGIRDSELAFVHTPIGVSIGAVTPEEIAVSVAGEMISVRAGYRKERGICATHCPV